MAHGRAWRLAMVVLAAVVIPPQLRAGAAAGVPLTRLPDGLWAVAVDAGPTSDTWRFLVDTGSTHTMLSIDAARRAQLAVVAGARLLTPAGAIDAGLATVPVLRIGDRVRTAMPVIVADLAALGRNARLDGILGMDALGRDPVLLDLVIGRLAFLDRAGHTAVRAGTQVPARTVEGRLVIDARVDGRPRGLVLDTGAAVTVVFDETPAGPLVGIRTAAGATRARAGRADLALGNVHLGIVPAVRMPAPRERSGSDGLLPATVFAQVYFDRAVDEVRVVPRG